MDERMDVGKVDYYARVDILRREWLVEEGWKNYLTNMEFQQNFSDVLIRRMLHEKKIPNFNIGGKLLYISYPQTIKQLENKIK